MSTPRFTVGSVSGDGSDGGYGSHWSTVWYVQDSAYGYRTVKSFIRPVGERRARDLAAFLNENTHVNRACLGCRTEITPELLKDSHTHHWYWRMYCSRKCSQASPGKGDRMAPLAERGTGGGPAGTPVTPRSASGEAA